MKYNRSAIVAAIFLAALFRVSIFIAVVLLALFPISNVNAGAAGDKSPLPIQESVVSNSMAVITVPARKEVLDILSKWSSEVKDYEAMQKSAAYKRISTLSGDELDSIAAKATDRTNSADAIDMAKKEMNYRRRKSQPHPLCLYTSAASPIFSLNSLKADEVACWGAELMDPYLDFLEAAGIREVTGEKVESARVLGVGNRPFTEDYLKRFPGKPPPRLFLTRCVFEDMRVDQGPGAGRLVLEGAARVNFISSAGK